MEEVLEVAVRALAPAEEETHSVFYLRARRRLATACWLVLLRRPKAWPAFLGDWDVLEQLGEDYFHEVTEMITFIFSSFILMKW